MPASTSDLILHQYDLSPFSEKIRLIFGRKSLEWFACLHPTIMPKPELIALTGGYRQIPVLQIGADIYCGTEVIADEIEALFPDPPLTLLSGAGLGRAFAYWAEETLFWLVVQVTCGSDFAYCEDDNFNRDREAMLPGLYDVAKMRAEMPANVARLRAHLDLVERQLGDGRAFLFGDAPDLVDFSLYLSVEFLGNCRNGNEKIPGDYPAMGGWLGRVKAIGSGVRQDITRQEALELARSAVPAPSRASYGKVGPAIGTEVRFKPWAPSGQIVEGELISSEPRRFAIRRTTAELGATVVHLPRSAGDFIT